MRLNKSLYGLKQIGANWYRHIKLFLIEKCILLECNDLPCVFKHNDYILCLFVDDMMIFSRNQNSAARLISTIQETFDTKVIHDGSLTEGKAIYNILGMIINYIFGIDMSFNMENILNDKLTKVGVHIDQENKKLDLPKNIMFD